MNQTQQLLVFLVTRTRNSSFHNTSHYPSANSLSKSFVCSFPKYFVSLTVLNILLFQCPPSPKTVMCLQRGSSLTIHLRLESLSATKIERRGKIFWIQSRNSLNISDSIVVTWDNYFRQTLLT